MQWSDDANAGFSDLGVETWLPVHDNYLTLNVEAQEGEPASHLNIYKALASLR